MINTPNWQPSQLSDSKVLLRPLLASDFDALFAVASDPLIWEQHPNKNRYQLSYFTNFFQGAMDSGGAMLILDVATGEAIGSSRFYDDQPDLKKVKIGYTFFARNCWGKGYNAATKSLMIRHALQWADTIIFHVGAANLRSIIAMQRLGAVQTGTEEVAYYGEPSKLNAVFQITRLSWQQATGK